MQHSWRGGVKMAYIHCSLEGTYTKGPSFLLLLLESIIPLYWYFRLGHPALDVVNHVFTSCFQF
jgi:hypothetical protein